MKTTFTSLEDKKNKSEEDKIRLLKDAIQEGIDSGIAENFDFKENLKKLKAEKKAK